MTRKKLKKRPPKNELRSKLPFIEHVYELRRRLMYVALSIIAFGTIAYLCQQPVIKFLLAPAHGQQFIYTSPGGGINFLFQICTYAGILASIPVIMYQLLGFFEPLLNRHIKQFIVRSSFFSAALAICGLCFGYFIGLPAALHFLSNQFLNQQIQALFTLQEYMSFVTIYLVGSALLFQIPLIMLFINRIKPLKPQKLLGFERYVIVLAFIAAALITPTPDIMNQTIIAGPIIIIYQLGIVLVWGYNRRPNRVAKLLKKDIALQAERLLKKPVAPAFTTALTTSQPTQRIRPATFNSTTSTASSNRIKRTEVKQSRSNYLGPRRHYYLDIIQP